MLHLTEEDSREEEEEEEYRQGVEDKMLMPQVLMQMLLMLRVSYPMAVTP